MVAYFVRRLPDVRFPQPLWRLTERKRRHDVIDRLNDNVRGIHMPQISRSDQSIQPTVWIQRAGEMPMLGSPAVSGLTSKT